MSISCLCLTIAVLVSVVTVTAAFSVKPGIWVGREFAPIRNKDGRFSGIFKGYLDLLMHLQQNGNRRSAHSGHRHYAAPQNVSTKELYLAELGYSSNNKTVLSVRADLDILREKVIHSMLTSKTLKKVMNKPPRIG